MTPWLWSGFQVREKGKICGSNIIKVLQATPENDSARLPIANTIKEDTKASRHTYCSLQRRFFCRYIWGFVNEHV